MIVTLIGSARFEEDFIEASKQLGLRGIAAFTLSAYPRDNGGKDWYSDDEKVILDLVHLNKIRVSDAVLVVGDGYIGFSTAREIIWAEMLGRTIVPQHYDWDMVCNELSNNWGNSEVIAEAKRVLKETSAVPINTP